MGTKDVGPWTLDGEEFDAVGSYAYARKWNEKRVLASEVSQFSEGGVASRGGSMI